MNLSDLALPKQTQTATTTTTTTTNAVAGPSRERNTNTNINTDRASASPPPDNADAQDGDDEDEEDEDDEGQTRPSGSGSGAGAARKRKGGAGMGSGSGAGGGAGAGAGTGGKGKATNVVGGKEYRYSAEIGQMMFVFGEVQDPLPETTRLVEDIVRGQVIEIVTRARLLTHLRSSRYLSAEDLIFLIRNDRGKVNRLRTYLSWKDVRKKATKDDENGAGGGDPLEMNEEEDKQVAKTRRAMVKLPWEVLTPFSDMLRGLPSMVGGGAGGMMGMGGAGGGGGGGGVAREEEEEEDEDEMQAYHDSMLRLREADEVTRRMTKDEYVHYSDCRQASFTYRKAKRFREFINFGAYLDVKPNDDIVDILGFLAFEMVRSLCVTALGVRQRMEAAPESQAQSYSQSQSHSQPLSQSHSHTHSQRRSLSPMSKKRKSVNINMNGSSNGGHDEASRSIAKRTKTDSINHSNATSSTSYPISLFAAPATARQPLLPAHVLEAFAQIQREQASARVGGLRNFRSGPARARMALV